MTLKIFYFLIAIFSLSVIFGLFDSSFNIGFEPKNVKVADLRAFDVMAHELNASVVSASYGAKEVVRYKDKDEIFGFSGSYFNDEHHELSSDFAEVIGNKIHMKQNALYENAEQNLSYRGDELIYDGKSLESNKSFVIEKGSHIIHANSGSYDIKNKKIKANQIKGDFEK